MRTPAWCLICGQVHEPFCEDWQMPEWVRPFLDSPGLTCGHLHVDGAQCMAGPREHLHAPYCGNGQDHRHHAWVPRPGTLAAAYAEQVA